MPLIVKKPIEIKKEETPSPPAIENLRNSLSSFRPSPKIKANIIKQNTQEPEPIPEKIVEVPVISPEVQKVEKEKGVSLIVNGEKRKVSKTSKYLLDMLTLDDQ